MQLDSLFDANVTPRKFKQEALRRRQHGGGEDVSGDDDQKEASATAVEAERGSLRG